MARPATPAASPASPWIYGPRLDLLLFIATPVLIVPAFLAARRTWSIEQIALFVAAFGALGHHFPGMLRAYGDRDLFRRFRVRFVAAPVFLVAVCSLFTLYELSGLLLVVALWGVWHGMAQTYGFLRIYDAKHGSRDPWTAKLDFHMCVAWFGVGLFLSPTRSFDLLDRFWSGVGGPLAPEGWVPAFRTGWAGWTALVTAAFVVHTTRRWKAGQPASPLKLALMATSFGFWVYTSVTIQNLLVGVALFEIFHDVQYLAIVWFFNRNRLEKGSDLGRFGRFLFRRSGALVGLYVGLVFAYGSLAFVQKGIPVEPLMGGLQGVLVASALLHFYYDGFIWKIRDASTRESLGVAKGGESSEPAVPGWALHGLKWALFVVPLAWLGVMEQRAEKRPDLDVARALVEAIPRSAVAHHELGRALFETGRPAEARSAFGRALELDPDYPDAHRSLALALADLGEYEAEREHLERALALRADFPEAHNDLGVALLAAGDAAAARRHFERALELREEYARAHNNLGLVLARERDLDGAIHHLERALEIDPGLTEVAEALARVRSTRAGIG